MGADARKPTAVLLITNSILFGTHSFSAHVVGVFISVCSPVGTHIKGADKSY